MSDENANYPAILYKDGKAQSHCNDAIPAADYVIVGDAGEEAAAGKEGYFRAGEKPAKAAK
jgi:hypothetical protein